MGKKNFSRTSKLQKFPYIRSQTISIWYILCYYTFITYIRWAASFRNEFSKKFETWKKLGIFGEISLGSKNQFFLSFFLFLERNLILLLTKIE